VEHFQALVEPVKFFFDSKCFEYLEQTESTKTFIIISQKWTEDFIRKVYHRANILLVYIIDDTGESAPSIKIPKWLEEYKKKVSGIQIPYIL
jgi:hypothetical protein